MTINMWYNIVDHFDAVDENPKLQLFAEERTLAYLDVEIYDISHALTSAVSK